MTFALVGQILDFFKTFGQRVPLALEFLHLVEMDFREEVDLLFPTAGSGVVRHGGYHLIVILTVRVVHFIVHAAWRMQEFFLIYIIFSGIMYIIRGERYLFRYLVTIESLRTLVSLEF